MSLAKELRPAEIPLNRIFLDPNNPRFVGENSRKVPDIEAIQQHIQDITIERLNDEYGISRLKENMEVNGFLPIDRIVVRQLPDDDFIVLEGNRRICAAKLIAREQERVPFLSDGIMSTMHMIPCLVYTGTMDDASWIFQGLRHITGILEWSAFHKAKLLVEQLENEAGTLTEIGRRFGLTGHGAGQWVRGYKAYQQAKNDTDYIDEIDEKSYPMFQELFSRSCGPLREWMDWNDDEKRFDDRLKLDEFVGWLYPKNQDGIDDDPSVVARGDWERRVLRKQDDLRTLASLIKSHPEEFESFRSDRSLDSAHTRAMMKDLRAQEVESSDIVKATFESLATCVRLLDNVPARVFRDAELASRLKGLMDNMDSKIQEMRTFF